MDSRGGKEEGSNKFQDVDVCVDDYVGWALCEDCAVASGLLRVQAFWRHDGVHRVVKLDVLSHWRDRAERSGSSQAW